MSIKVTPSARKQIQTLIEKRGQSITLGIRIRIKNHGCSGLGYSVEYVDALHPGDTCFEQDGFKIFLDSKAMLYLVGTEMDYVETLSESGFIFRNPNEKGRCGCGQSFHV
jgi:iron-sulfur cluster assembly protein